MGTKQFSNYSDLLTFTRASKGHALRPVSYGAELVTNGDFSSTDLSAWTELGNPTATVSGGELTLSGDGGYDDYIQQEISVTAGKVYRVQVTARRITGSVRIQVRDASSPYTTLEAQTFSSSSNETFTANFVAPTNAVNIQLLQWSGTTGSGVFDNLSVKEVTFDESDGTLTLFEHPNNVPRVEWDADGNRLGLLVEKARTNLITYSEDFSDSAWTKSGAATVTASSVTTPDGQQNGFLLEATGTDRIEETPSTTITGTATLSIFAKYDDVPYVQMTILDSSANGQRQWFKIQDGTLGSSAAVGTGKNLDGASITDMNNGFYRLSLSVDGFSGQTARCLIYLARTDSSFDAASGDSAVVYGAQLEAGSFPTSYIKSNSGSTTTRSADVASIPVADFGFNAKSMSMLIEWQTIIPAPVSWDGYNRIVSFGESGGSELIEILGTQNTASVYGAISAGGVQQLAYIQFSTDGTAEKTAFRAGSDTWRIADNGTLLTEDTSVTMPTKIDRLGIGIVGTTLSNNELNGHIKSIKYYPRRLTNAQLQDLTS